MTALSKMGEVALELAAAGWQIHPLHGKVPLLPHGLRDASTDPVTVERWWRRWPRANIGAVVPASLIVIDLDPRAGAVASLRALEAEYGKLPPTLTVRTGGADHGQHRYFLKPAGPVATAKFGKGIDLRLPERHYTVLPPSVHPESGREYEWVDPNVASVLPPAWLAARLRPAPRPPAPTRPAVRGEGDRPGDLLAASLSWRQILEPCGWVWVRSHDAIEYWRRPGKDEGISATTNGRGTDRLHVFSSSAEPFEADESYSKFGAFTLLEHAGDFAAAARALRKEAVSA